MRSLSWRLLLRVITALSWVLAVLWFVTEPGYEPLIAVVAGIGTLLGSFAASDAPITEYRPIPEQRLRNRRVMLGLVRSFWVKGVLEPSLHGAAMIELGLERRGGAADRAWDTVLQRPGQANVPIPRGTRIISVFNAMNKELLILGAPGSGKTTMLLELARDAIARAEQDPTRPIPVVFNLSSWADERQPIADWLVVELNTKYNIPKKIARPWVECDELLLLLDGLDEVALRCREDCIRAINEFRQEHLVPLVVCSRVADYEALTARLTLQGAVLLQPLTPQQIDEYLGGAGMALSAVRETLQDDPMLQQLAETPLMLSIMTLAYQGVSVEDLQALDTVEVRRQHLFDTYVQRMFERRGADQSYSSRQTIHWLAWLAQKMLEHAQTVFLIERLQPDWLPARGQRQLHIVLKLICGLIGGLGGIVAGVPFAGLDVGLDIRLGVGLVFGLAVGLSVWYTAEFLGGRDSILPVEALEWSWRGARTGLGVGLVSGLIVGLASGLIVGLGVGLVSGLIVGLESGLVSGLIIGLEVGLGAALTGVLFLGLSGAKIETRMVPNQSIRQSATNALIVGLGSALVAGLGSALVAGLGSVLVAGLGSVLIGVRIFGPGVELGLGLVFGLLFGLGFGGKAAILHLVLRYFLWRKGYLPWNLARFLDYAAERIFLRKVGGGYIFVHRLLQDHFASLYQDQ